MLCFNEYFKDSRPSDSPKSFILADPALRNAQKLLFYKIRALRKRKNFYFAKSEPSESLKTFIPCNPSAPKF